MTRTWQSTWLEHTQKNRKERFSTYLDITLVSLVLIAHLILLIKFGPIGYIMKVLGAFSAIVPG